MGRGRQKPERRNGTLLVSRMGTLLVSSKPILFSQSYALEKRLSRLLGTRRDLARTAACPVRNPGLKTPSINTDAVDWFHCKKALLDVSAGRNNRPPYASGTTHRSSPREVARAAPLLVNQLHHADADLNPGATIPEREGGRFADVSDTPLKRYSLEMET